MVPIPEREMVVAKALGLTEVEARRSWERYVTLTTERHGEHILLGGTHWKRWAEEDAVNGVARRSKAQEANHKKALEDEAYAREAVTFEAWADALAKKAAAGAPLTEHDASVARWWQGLTGRKPTGMDAAWAFGEWHAAERLPLSDERRRTVRIVDARKNVVGTRRMGDGELAGLARASPRRALEIAHVPDDQELEERRQQSLTDLGEFARGLGLEGTGT